MAKSLKEQLIGTWCLLKYTLQNDDGTDYFPLGEDCRGFLIYTADGYVSAQLMASGRPVYQSGDLHEGTPEEMAAAAEGYIAYAGKYSVDEVNTMVRHQMDVSMNPTWQDQIQERYLEIDGNKVTIRAPVNSGVLTWEKVSG
ncbi:lipocalin-like domain-containing protein [Alteromonas lipolytica]|uniref:Lipocalin-like domain-containing protein n=1 Tax=Alteromonas lipolytica TaxID=1856405 RepID=A0A1E8FCK6_9ALTE|nr:lipocalin-like domain-containing protein [Alteromonas lipolytica]OFI33651.1 hypothetical protein BFC17_18905 [Alteromonas lipolytica]GGF69642.1 hypothetical protein GCM10011338_22240 [Alteromonas lipolytica]